MKNAAFDRVYASAKPALDDVLLLAQLDATANQPNSEWAGKLFAARQRLAAMVSAGNAYVAAELACAQDDVGRKALLEAKEAARAAFVAALADCGGAQ